MRARCAPRVFLEHRAITVRALVKAAAGPGFALREVAHHVLALSSAEDLPAHGSAVSVRFPGQDLAG